MTHCNKIQAQISTRVKFHALSVSPHSPSLMSPYRGTEVHSSGTGQSRDLVGYYDIHPSAFHCFAELISYFVGSYYTNSSSSITE